VIGDHEFAIVSWACLANARPWWREAQKRLYTRLLPGFLSRKISAVDYAISTRDSLFI